MSRFSLNYVLILIFNKTTLEEKNDSNEDFIINYHKRSLAIFHHNVWTELEEINLIYILPLIYLTNKYSSLYDRKCDHMQNISSFNMYIKPRDAHMPAQKLRYIEKNKTKKNKETLLGNTHNNLRPWTLI